LVGSTYYVNSWFFNTLAL